MFKKMMRKLSGLKNRAFWSWGPSWPRPDRLQVKSPSLMLLSQMLQQDLEMIHRTLLLTLKFVCFFNFYLFRTGGSAEICKAFPDFHQQGQGCPTGAFSAGPLSWHGGSDGAGGRAVSGVHWVGQGWEENLLTPSSGGEEADATNNKNAT